MRPAYRLMKPSSNSPAPSTAMRTRCLRFVPMGPRIRARPLSVSPERALTGRERAGSALFRGVLVEVVVVEVVEALCDVAFLL